MSDSDRKIAQRSSSTKVQLSDRSTRSRPFSSTLSKEVRGRCSRSARQVGDSLSEKSTYTRRSRSQIYDVVQERFPYYKTKKAGNWKVRQSAIAIMLFAILCSFAGFDPPPALCVRDVRQDPATGGRHRSGLLLGDECE